jgi:aspartate/methionine/tyrosine aminotransferase
VEPNERRRARYLNARNYFSICSGAINERLGTLALTHSDAIYSKARAASGRNLKTLDAFFAEHRGVLNWRRPRGGMTAYPWMPGVSDTRPFCEELLKRGVMIAPGDCFGAPEHFRLGFAAADIAQFSRALERFPEAMRAVAAG